MSELNHFKVLNNINVSEKIEKKQNLSYLSWTWAWQETKKHYPNAKYGIIKNEKGLPYFYDENTGYMVFTWVEIEGVRHDMWLPVLSNNSNKAMKNEPYTYDTKYNKGLQVESATMFDINKSLMRCLTKNLAMFGLGLYVFSGEDMPEEEKTDMEWKNIRVKSEKAKQVCKWFRDKYNKNFENALQGLKAYNIKHFNDLDEPQNKANLSLITQMITLGNKNLE